MMVVMGEGSEGMGGGLGKEGELIFFKGEDLGVGEGEVRFRDRGLDLGLIVFFFGDDKSVYLPGEDFCWGRHLSPLACF